MALHHGKTKRELFAQSANVVVEYKTRKSPASFFDIMKEPNGERRTQPEHRSDPFFPLDRPRKQDRGL
jgi:hypothetical protein